MSADRPETSTSRGRRYAVPLLLALLFLGPLALAWYLYFGAPHIRPDASASHGTLVQPPVPLPALEGPDGTLLRDVWTVVHVSTAPCGDACEEALHGTRQVHRALGRRYDRVSRLYLGAELPSSAVREGHPDLTFVRIAPEHRELVEAFTRAGGAPDARRVFIVDPLGNLMMRYPPGADPGGLLDDLERLLRLSNIG